MRRPRDSDSDEDDIYPKRDRIDETVESLLYRVGFKDSKHLDRDITQLSSVVIADIVRNEQRIMKTLLRCVKQIPERVQIYAVLLGLINLRNRTFVNQVTFLAASVPCRTVSASSMLGVYENFAEVTHEARECLQSRTDFFTHMILYSLPHCASFLASEDISGLNEILGTLEVYLAKRLKSHVSLLRVWENDDPHIQEDYLDCLWAQIQTMRVAGWQERVTFRLIDQFPSLLKDASGVPHHFLPIIPPNHDADVTYPLPRVVFRLFDYTDVVALDDDEQEEDMDADESKTNKKVASEKTPAILPGSHTIERFCLDNQLTLLMDTLSFNRAHCANAMLNLRTRAPVALEYMIVENVFASLFQLPSPPVQHGQLLFYGSLLIQLCHEAPNTIPLVLAQATELLYERLGQMKPVCISRMIEWFSYHLSNYHLRWSWEEWLAVTGQHTMSPNRRLVTETFARLVRFSYYDNVKRLVPKPFYKLLPPQPTVFNKYELNPDLATCSLFNRLLDAMRGRATSDVVHNLVKRISSRSSRLLLADSRRGEPFQDEDGQNQDSVDDDSMDEDTVIMSSPSSNHQNDDEVAGSDDDAEDGRRVKLKAKRRVKATPRRPSTMVLDANSDPLATIGCLQLLSPGVKDLTIELFFSAIFIAGHKTVSHSGYFIRRYASIFRLLSSSVDSQVEVLHVLQTIWARHPQMIVILTEYMCRVGLIDPEAVIMWAYSPIMMSLTSILDSQPGCGNSPAAAADRILTNASLVQPALLDFYVWECLNRTLLRVGRRVLRITKRLDAAKELLETEGNRSASSSDAEEVSAVRDPDESVNTDDPVGQVKTDPPALPTDSYAELLTDDELFDSSSTPAGNKRGRRGRNNNAAMIARLEEARCEAVRSQCTVITLLLHRHARLTDEVDQAAAAALSENDATSLKHVAFWLHGRLVQVVLEHCEQLIPYLVDLETLISGSHPSIQRTFQQIRSLCA